MLSVEVRAGVDDDDPVGTSVSPPQPAESVTSNAISSSTSDARICGTDDICRNSMSIPLHQPQTFHNLHCLLLCRDFK
ncbi:MAG: hypothetical protein RIT02_855 [Planctomycetota bacterium]